MAEEKGFPVILKLNHAPQAQYQQGHSLIVQGATGAAVAKLLDGLTGHEGNGELILASFVEYGLRSGVEVKMQASAPEHSIITPSEVIEKIESEAVKKAKALRAAKAENAARPVTAAAPAADAGELATPAYLQVVAKKTGKSLEELQGLTKDQAKGLVEEVSK